MNLLERFVQKISQHTSENHHVYVFLIALILFTTISSYDLPQDDDSNFSNFRRVLQRIENRYGVNIKQLFVIIFTFCFVIGSVSYLVSPLVTEDYAELYTLYQRKRYAQVLFLNLLNNYSNCQHQIKQAASLAELNQIWKSLETQIQNFRSAATKVITPTVQEYLMAPEEYFYIDASFIENLDKRYNMLIYSFFFQKSKD